VVQDGKIVERGKHEELLQLDGLYKKLYQEQFDAERMLSSGS
jgi:ABC-type multidrug transport system fused ATPase/permease subunit